jgi:tetratricopeptide (TPR) repeat protein
MKLMPGVRLNFSKSTMGLSFGVPGARYTINTKGRRTFSTGIPGTGLYNVETLSSGTRTSRASRTTSGQQSAEESFRDYEPPVQMRPGLFSRKSERQFYKFLMDIYRHDAKDTPQEVFDKATALKTKYPALQIPLDLVIFLHTIGSDTFDNRIDAWGQTIWDNRLTYFGNGIVLRYFQGITPQVTISPGIQTQEIYNMQTFLFMWVELLQNRQKYKEALAVIESMQSNQYTAISMADVEITMKDFDAAIETTEEIENEDDATAMLLILRGIAFREKELYDGALECFKRALAKKDRSEIMKHRAHFERAENYSRMGKKAMAVKDLEKILVDDSDYPDVVEKLAELKN